MATTVTPAATASFQLGPFDTLTLSSGRARGSIALTSQAPKLCADQTLSPQNGTFGPWGAPMSVVMTITQGSCDYTVNARSLTVDEVVAAQSLVSGASISPAWAASAKAKLALASTQLVRVAAPGDSLTVGAYSSDPDSTSWLALVRIALQAKYGDGGSGYRSVALSVPVSPGYGGIVPSASRWTVTGTWVASLTVPDGPAGCAIVTTGPGTATCTVRGTIVEVFFVGDSSTYGTVTVSIDGVAQTPVALGARPGKEVTVLTYSGLATGNHTVLVTVASSNTVALFGASGRNTTGVVVDNYGRSGFPSNAFNNVTGDTFATAIGTFGGANRGLYGPAGKWSGGSLRPAEIVIYSLIVNDAALATTPDAYMANVRGFVDDVKDGTGQSGTADVLFNIMARGATTWEDAATKYFVVYAQRMQSYAKSIGAAVNDVWAAGRASWAWMTAQGYVGNSASLGNAGTDPVHESNTGHADLIAAPIITALV